MNKRNKRNATFGEMEWFDRPAVYKAETVRENRRWYNPNLRSEVTPMMIQYQGTRLVIEPYNNFNWYRDQISPKAWSKYC